MFTMFQECNKLEHLALSEFNTENVTDMSCLFNECNKLKEKKGINNFITNKLNTIKKCSMDSMNWNI